MELEVFLAAIARLPEVGTPLLRDCDGIRALHARAAELERTAACLREQADQMARILRGRAEKHWPACERRAAGLEVK